MDASEALRRVNDELARYGQPGISLTDEQSRRAFASLRTYAEHMGRPLEVAIQDMVRFEMNGRMIQRSN